jgi:hypothetical protein
MWVGGISVCATRCGVAAKGRGVCPCKVPGGRAHSAAPAETQGRARARPASRSHHNHRASGEEARRAGTRHVALGSMYRPARLATQGLLLTSTLPTTPNHHSATESKRERERARDTQAERLILASGTPRPAAAFPSLTYSNIRKHDPQHLCMYLSMCKRLAATSGVGHAGEARACDVHSVMRPPIILPAAEKKT